MPDHSALTLKLRQGCNLGVEEAGLLDRLAREAVPIPAGQDLVSEADDARHVHFVETGTACHYKILPDGRRAIVALLLPGDFCDLHVQLLNRMDHSIGALTDCEVTRIRGDIFEDLLQHNPKIDRACTWASLVDSSILREWLVNIGRRSAMKQLAHLFCEMHARLAIVDLTRDHRFSMPYTQVILADLLGLTPVHVQRTMSRLRDAGLITLQGRELHIPDFAALARLGEFDPAYLHQGLAEH